MAGLLQIAACLLSLILIVQEETGVKQALVQHPGTLSCAQDGTGEKLQKKSSSNSPSALTHLSVCYKLFLKKGIKYELVRPKRTPDCAFATSQTSLLSFQGFPSGRRVKDTQ